MEFSESFYVEHKEESQERPGLDRCIGMVRGILSLIPCYARVYADISDDRNYVLGLYLGIREVKEEVIDWINRVMEDEGGGLDVKITGYTRVADTNDHSLTVRLTFGNRNLERKFIPVNGTNFTSTKDWEWLAKRINKGKTLIGCNEVGK